MQRTPSAPLMRKPLGNRQGIFVLLALAVGTSACFPFGDGGVLAEGVVADSVGRPVAGALVVFLDPGRERWPSLFETHTNDQGRFQLSSTVAPGRYLIPLRIQADGFKSAELPLRTLKSNVVSARLALANSDEMSHIQVEAGR
jgi:hypothetical protein